MINRFVGVYGKAFLERKGYGQLFKRIGTYDMVLGEAWPYAVSKDTGL